MTITRSLLAAAMALTTSAGCNAGAHSSNTIQEAGPGRSGGSVGARAGVSAISHVTIIDGTGAPARPDMTVIIEGRRILSVAPSNAVVVPAGANEIDGRGKYLVPGFIDSHIHTGTQSERPASMNEAILRNALLGGVTTARDMGGRTELVRSLALRSTDDTTPWPRLYLSAIMAGPGSWFDGPRGIYMAGSDVVGESPLVRRVGAGTDVARVIADAKAAGATGIKIYNSVQAPLIRELVAEAHRQGLRAWSHLSVDPAMPSEVIASGVDAVSHADQFIVDVMRPMPTAPVAERRAVRDSAFIAAATYTTQLRAMIADMRRRGTTLDATLFVMAPRPDSLGRVTPQAARLFHFAAGMVRLADSAGVPIVAGTDNIGGGSPNIHAELQLLVDSAGLSPLHALRAATLNGALVLGIADSVGTIAPGKLADLIMLRADPIEDIANTQTLAWVMKAGRMYPRTTPMTLPLYARPPRLRAAFKQ